MIASSWGRFLSSLADSVRMELIDVRSSCSGWRDMRWCRGVSSRLDWRSRCCSRRLTVSSLFRESRVEGMRVRHWKDGRVETNSSISRQHVPKPRPLVAVNFSHLRNIMILPIRTSDKHIVVLVVVLRMKTSFHVCFGLDRKSIKISESGTSARHSAAHLSRTNPCNAFDILAIRK